VADRPILKNNQDTDYHPFIFTETDKNSLKQVFRFVPWNLVLEAIFVEPGK